VATVRRFILLSVGLNLSEVITLGDRTTLSLLLLAVADMPARRRSVRFKSKADARQEIGMHR
jgi:hypothetical protein